MNAQAILTWIKANIFIVIFAIVMIAAAIVLPIVSSGMNTEVKSIVQARADQISKLDNVLKGEITDPAGKPIGSGAITDEFLARYEQVAALMDTDAKAVQAAALKHNRKDRGVIRPDVLPEMAPAMRDVLPRKFWEDLRAAYDRLLAEVNAGMPPDLESMRETLLQARSTFISQELKKDPENPELEPEEQQNLTEHLAKARMSLYADAAESIGVYLSPATLNIPEWSQENQPDLAGMFAWQWQYWITEDLLRALHESNKTDAKVVRSPVKQILGLTIHNLPGASGGGGQGGTQSGGPPRLGSAGAGAAAPALPTGDEDGGAAAPVGAAFDPRTPVAADFKDYLSGRVSNGLYDVINVQLDMVVETSRLPEVLDRLAAYNFISIADLSLTPADSFAAAQYGYVFGPKAVSQVSLILQTVWLREWTKEFMPDSVRTLLNIPARAPASAQPPATPDVG